MSARPILLIEGGPSGALVKPNAKEVIRFGNIGAHMELLICKIGGAIERKVGKALHEHGHGPIAVLNLLLDGLKKEPRQQVIRSTTWDKEVMENCERLVAYALPKNSTKVRIQAFKGLVELSTRYPYLGKFLRHCHKDGGSGLGGKNDPIKTKEPTWSHFFQYATDCLSEKGIAACLWNQPPDEWGHASFDNNNVMHRLVVDIRDSSGAEDISRLVAIRYLGTILELDAFWKDECYKNHSPFAKFMFKVFVKVLEDVGLAMGVECKVMERTLYDDMAIDHLAKATVVGVDRWVVGSSVPMQLPESQPWYQQFIKLVALIRSPAGDVVDIVPQARKLVEQTEWIPPASGCLYEAKPVKATQDPKDDTSRSAETKSSDAVIERTLDGDDDGPSRGAAAQDPPYGGGDGLAARGDASHGLQGLENEEPTRNVSNAFEQIQQLCDNSSLPLSVSETAKILYLRAEEENLLRGKSVEAIFVACIYIACRQAHVPRTFKEISELTNVPKKLVGQCYKTLERAFNLTPGAIANNPTTEDLMARYCNHLDLPIAFQAYCSEVAAQARTHDVASGRSPIAIAAGVIYFTTLLFGYANEAGTQNEVDGGFWTGDADLLKDVGSVAGMSEGTVKLVYRLLWKEKENLVSKDWFESGKASWDNLPTAERREAGDE